jgi:hypothetical protein
LLIALNAMCSETIASNTEVASPESKRWYSFRTRPGKIISSCAVLLIVAYLSGYYWARKSGLFLGPAPPIGPNQRTVTRYEIIPVGYYSLGIYNDGTMTEEEVSRGWVELEKDQTRSVMMWKYYAWMAAIEESFRN